MLLVVDELIKWCIRRGRQDDRCSLAGSNMVEVFQKARIFPDDDDDCFYYCKK